MSRSGASACRATLAGALLLVASSSAQADAVALAALDDLDGAQLDAIATRVFVNETGGDASRLLWWNQGEHFMSVGIGHAIWYPAGVQRPYRESFPDLLEYLQSAGLTLPAWLGPGDPCPWPDRDAWLAAGAAGDTRVVSLRALIESSTRVQAGFLVKRLRADLATLFEGLPEVAVERLRVRLQGVATAPGGVFALVDYVNFKGDGRHPGERYAGQGWGLLQVLAAMADQPGVAPLQAFAEAAEAVLRRRVGNAPAARGESRWLAGWLHRVRGYRAP